MGIYEPRRGYKASIKAFAQLLFHSTHHVDKMITDWARLTRSEGEKSDFLRKLKEDDNKHKKELKSKDSSISFLQKEVTNQVEMLKSLNDNFNTQEAELSSLRARLENLEDHQRNGFPDEKQEIQDEHFVKGFNFYLVGFMANDPDYTFEKFGQDTVEEMAEFRRVNTQIIKEMRIELGFEEPEDAPSDQEAQIADGDAPPNKETQEENDSEAQVIQPLPSQTSEHGAPPNDANVTPLQTLDANRNIPSPAEKSNQDTP